MFGPTTPLFFFLGALLYLFPKAGMLVLVAIYALAMVVRRFG